MISGGGKDVVAGKEMVAGKDEALNAKSLILKRE